MKKRLCVSFFLVVFSSSVFALKLKKTFLSTITERYAPILYFHPGEKHYAAAVEDVFPYMTAECGQKRGGGGEEKVWLQTKQKLKNPDEILPWFYGRKPGTPGFKTPPAYAMVTTKKDGDASGVYDVPGADFMITYYFFYPYNLGKRAILCPSSPFLKTDTRITFGNHVGDWERVTLLFKMEENFAQPIEVRYDFHQWENYYNWNTRKWVRGEDDFKNDMFTKEGDHPVGYIGRGGHGTWTNTSPVHSSKSGEKCYKTTYGPKGICGTVLDLCDEVGKGKRWDTGENIFLITEDMWQDGYQGEDVNAFKLGLGGIRITNWFTQINRWGNNKSWQQPNSCGISWLPRKKCIPLTSKCVNFRKIFDEKIGECRLNSGPTAPFHKGAPIKHSGKCTTPPCRCG